LVEGEFSVFSLKFSATSALGSGGGLAWRPGMLKTENFHLKTRGEAA
jgi:hypothetical protein